MDGGRSPLTRAGLASVRSSRRPGRLVRRDRVVPVLALALLGAATTGLLGWYVDGDDSGDRVDDVLEGVVDTVAPMESGVGRLLGEVIADLGSPVSTAVLMLLVAAFAHLCCGPRALALVLVGPPIAMITTTTILKPLIGRTRGDELAFPSGHTTSITAIATALVVVVLSLSPPPKVRRWSLVVLVAVPVAVAVCLVGREYHYPTDAVGAVGLALAVVLVAAIVVDAMADSMADEPHEIGPAETAGEEALGGGSPLTEPVCARPTARGAPVGGAVRMRPPPGGPPVPMGPPVGGSMPAGPVGGRPFPPGPVPPGPVPREPLPAPAAPPEAEEARAEPTPAEPSAPPEVEHVTEVPPTEPAARVPPTGPEAMEPEVVEPDAGVPEATEPEAVEPEAVEPEVVEPDAGVPEATEPEAVEPGAGAPETAVPDVVEPDAVSPSDEEPAAGSSEVGLGARRRSPVRHRSLALRTPSGPRRGA